MQDKSSQNILFNSITVEDDTYKITNSSFVKYYDMIKIKCLNQLRRSQYFELLMRIDKT